MAVLRLPEMLAFDGMDRTSHSIQVQTQTVQMKQAVNCLQNRQICFFFFIIIYLLGVFGFSFLLLSTAVSVLQFRSLKYVHLALFNLNILKRSF